jgi:fatty-acid desaturase
MDGFGMHDGVDGLVLGAYWGGIVRIALGHNVIWSINSFCHAVGRRPYRDRRQVPQFFFAIDSVFRRKLAQQPS